MNRRKINRSYNFVAAQKANWNVDSSGNSSWSSYRGPMVSWIRLCSNGAGRPSDATLQAPPDKQVFDKQRFVLYSGKGFYQTYGFQPPTTPGGSPYQVIGYTPGDYENADFGQPHIIQNSLIKPNDEPVNYPIHVPAPEISKVEVTVQKELYRRAQIEWVCFSWKQLVYMTPYFLVPGITCMVEWGWNHYNIESLVNLGDTGTMRSLWDNAYPLYTKNILKSNGNYDVVYGIISNFSWEIQGNKIICMTEVTSKVRLYAGIAKDNALSVADAKNGVFQDLKSFINKSDNIKNLKNIVQTPNVLGNLSAEHSKTKSSTWLDILNPLLSSKDLTPEQKGMRFPWVFGIFSGRPKDSYTTKEKFGTPRDSDFDKTVGDDDPDKIWINMGLVVRILNFFSALPSGANKGNNAFEVDIQNSVIGAHPNMISCDRRVLVPNSAAPKFFYGQEGKKQNQGKTTKDAPYKNQVLRPIPIQMAKSGMVPNIPNLRLQEVMRQPDNNCYRDDLDKVINYNIYRNRNANQTGVTFPVNSYAFPADIAADIVLPKSPRGLEGNQLETGRSGLLSNIYISFKLLQEAVNDEGVASYVDIYNYILTVLMSSVDYFWDLQMVDVENVLTIADKKFIGKYALDNTVDAQGNKHGAETVYSFDYMDADSIIKSLKFKPVLADAQATRVMYGAVNNSGSKYAYLDKNDLLDYQFKDAVINTPEDRKQGDPDSELGQRSDPEDELGDLLKIVQCINANSDDGTLQMSLNPTRLGLSAPPGTPSDAPEVIKLVMPEPPGQQLLRMLFNDDDEQNNARYCAVQPGIILEMTLQGIGGLRTFQYFTVRNLPEPYSDRNVIFRITDVQQSLEAGNWETTIRAQPMPLRGYIKQRLIGPYGNNGNGGWPPDVK